MKGRSNELIQGLKSKLSASAKIKQEAHEGKRETPGCENVRAINPNQLIQCNLEKPVVCKENISNNRILTMETIKNELFDEKLKFWEDLAEEIDQINNIDAKGRGRHESHLAMKSTNQRQPEPEKKLMDYYYACNNNALRTQNECLSNKFANKVPSTVAEPEKTNMFHREIEPATEIYANSRSAISKQNPNIVRITSYPTLQNPYEIIPDLDFINFLAPMEFITKQLGFQRHPLVVQINLEKKKDSIIAMFQSLLKKNTNLEKAIHQYRHSCFRRNRLDYALQDAQQRKEIFLSRISTESLFDFIRTRSFANFGDLFPEEKGNNIQISRISESQAPHFSFAYNEDNSGFDFANSRMSSKPVRKNSSTPHCQNTVNYQLNAQEGTLNPKIIHCQQDMCINLRENFVEDWNLGSKSSYSLCPVPGNGLKKKKKKAKSKEFSSLKARKEWQNVNDFNETDNGPIPEENGFIYKTKIHVEEQVLTPISLNLNYTAQNKCTTLENRNYKISAEQHRPEDCILDENNKRVMKKGTKKKKTKRSGS